MKTEPGFVTLNSRLPDLLVINVEIHGIFLPKLARVISTEVSIVCRKLKPTLGEAHGRQTH
eukprot:CAMPEP_0170588070 /NCGR_PEP_ID=MMETSP0224-20130122/10631_1 /TAXON_ID=285029 /ORGANISM="Togula jolla, Strain CCCM 725" /LENGTH=60 /DNA_ID=CAMNT_0010911757 /DNA_START=26 /DNA_END=205 /DNA_ORIENTATION=+